MADVVQQTVAAGIITGPPTVVPLRSILAGASAQEVERAVQNLEQAESAIYEALHVCYPEEIGSHYWQVRLHSSSMSASS